MWLRLRLRRMRRRCSFRAWTAWAPCCCRCSDLEIKQHLIAHMSKLVDHLERCETATNSAPCSVCTKGTKKRCAVCVPKKANQKGVPLCPGVCFIRYHDKDFHGLCACDLVEPTSWKEPSKARKIENAKKIRLFSGFESGAILHKT